MGGINFNWSSVTTKCLGGPRSRSNCEVQARWQDGPQARATDRKVLRKAFGNYYIQDSSKGTHPQLPGTAAQCGTLNGLGILTPFRRAMNAGDPYGTVNKAPSSTLAQKPHSQVNAPSRTTLAGWGVLAGSGSQTVAGGSAYTGNTKYVYDSSDYIRYKKLIAKNNNYNDVTFGGDKHNGSYVPLMRVRH